MENTRERYDKKEKEDRNLTLQIARMGAVVLIVGFVLIAAVGPIYKVWEQEQTGKAELARAEFNKQIIVETAKAQRDSATLLAEAEVERAKGVAKANEIIGESLKENEAYLRYLWINGLQDGSSEVIYVPTEANLPILEATRGLK